MSVRHSLYVGAGLAAIAGAAMLVIGLASFSGDGSAETIVAIRQPSGFAAVEPAPVPEPVSGYEDVTGAPAVPFAEEIVPTRVRIPSIEVDASIVDLGLNPDRTLEVPEDIARAGWYTGRSVPGEIGPGVIVGHVDSAVGGTGVFFNLRQLGTGDLIDVQRSDGSVAAFRVTEVVLVDKDEFPTDQVYGGTARPTLRLITCGGGFNNASGHYLGNLIVYAEHLGIAMPAHTWS